LGKQFTAAEHIECSTSRTELDSHAQYNHDIRNACYPDCYVAGGALGRAFDRDGIWGNWLPRQLGRLLRRFRDSGASRPMSEHGDAFGQPTIFKGLSKAIAVAKMVMVIRQSKILEVITHRTNFGSTAK